VHFHDVIVGYRCSPLNNPIQWTTLQQNNYRREAAVNVNGRLSGLIAAADDRNIDMRGRSVGLVVTKKL